VAPTVRADQGPTQCVHLPCRIVEARSVIRQVDSGIARLIVKAGGTGHRQSGAAGSVLRPSSFAWVGFPIWVTEI